MKLPLLSPSNPGGFEHLAPSAGLDCIVVGPHIADLHDIVERAKSTRGVSAHWDDVTLSSVLVGGRRLSYTDLLNKTLGDATGRPHDLSPFRTPSAAVCYLTSFLRRRKLNV